MLEKSIIVSRRQRAPHVSSCRRAVATAPTSRSARVLSPPMAAAWPALVGAADAWRAVLAFAQPPDWLRASAATASMLRAYRTERAELLRVNVPQASVESLIDGGEIGQLWCLLQTSPHLVNAPLEGHALTYPLHAAVDPLAPSGLRAATLLLHMRALVDNRDFDRESALHAAAALCNPPVVRLLLQSMSDANLRSRFGAAPLHCAAHGGDASVVSLLLETAMDLDAQAHDGSTPILLASEGNHVMVADRSAPPPFMGLLGSSWIRSASGVAGAAAPAAERRGPHLRASPPQAPP